MTPENEAVLLKIQDPPMEGWCSHEKACVLFNLVEQFRPQLAVELGVFAGRSLIAIALGLKSVGFGIVFGIDPWKTDAAIEGTNRVENDDWWKQVPWERIIQEYFDKQLEFGVLEYTSHFRRHDLDCLQFFGYESIDLIHFDSNHSEEVAVRTVLSWWQKLTPGCVIIMDDIDWEGQSKAVKVLLDYGCKIVMQYDTYAVYQKPESSVSVPIS